MGLSNNLISQFVDIMNQDKVVRNNSTVYGTIKKVDNTSYVQIDGSDLLTPIQSTAMVSDGERVTVMIKDHQAIVTGNITSPATRLDDIEVTVGDKIAEYDVVITGHLQAETARIDELVSQNITVTGTLTAQNAIIENLKATKLDAEEANIKFATIIDLEANTIKVNTIEGDLATFKQLTTDNFTTTNATIQQLTVDKANVADLNATNATIQQLKTDVAYVSDLTAVNADIQNLKANKADVTTLNAAIADIGTLTSNVAQINNIIGGNITSDNIQTGGITGDNLNMDTIFVNDANIISVNASKINAGSINTTNVTISSQNGGITISDNTQQFRDKNGKVRVQIGQDATGSFNFGVFDETGTGVLIDSTGVKEKALSDGIIKDRMISTGEISGAKLNISSVITEINKDSNTSTIKGSKVVLDSDNQKLDVAFTSLKKQADDTKTKTESNTTQLGIEQGRINTLIQDTTITKDGQNLKLKDEYSKLEQSVSGIKSTVAQQTTDISNVTNKVNSLKVGGRNFALNTKDNILSTNTNAVKQYLVSQDLFASAKGSYVTVSAFISGTFKESTNPHYGIDICFQFRDGSTSKWSGVNRGDFPVINNDDGSKTIKAQRYYATDLIPDKDISSITNTQYFIRGMESVSEFIIKDVKIEIGNKATDWSPAPEDIDNKISTTETGLDEKITTITNKYTTLSQDLSGFKTTVGNTYSTKTEVSNLDGEVTSLTTRVSTAESGITQLSDQIRLKVEQSDINTAIDTAKQYTNTTVSSAVADIKLTTDGITQRVAKTESTLATTTSTADTALSNANNANTQIGTIKEELSSTNSKVSEITTTLNGIDLKVQSTQETVKSHTESIAAVDNKISSAVDTSKQYTNDQISTVNQTITDKVAQIKLTTDSITQRVASTESTLTTTTSTANSALTNANNANNKIDGLTIGGRNLISVSDVALFGTTGKYDKDTNTWTLVGPSGTQSTWGVGLKITNNKVRVSYGQTYVCSFEIKVPITCRWNVDINNFAVTGSSWASNDNDLVSNRADNKSELTPNVWHKCWFRYENKHASNVNLVDIYDNSNFGIINNTGADVTFSVRNIKGEIGTKPTDWSPSPTDTKNEAVDTSKQYTNDQISTVNKTITDKVAEIKLTTDSITQRVASTESTLIATTNIANAANNKIDSLQLGGTNLLYGTSDFSGATSMSGIPQPDTFNSLLVIKGVAPSAVNSLINLATWSNSLDLRPGITYTLSFWAKASQNDVKVTSYLYPSAVSSGVNSSGNKTSMSDGYIISNISTTWKRYWISWTTPTEISGLKSVIPVRLSNGITTSGVEVYLAGVKFEEGNKATDWSPAPNDAENKIINIKDRVSKVEINLDSITSRVATTESSIITTDNELVSIKSRLQSAEQKITNDSIISTVTSSSNWTTISNNASKALESANSANSKIDNLSIGGRNFVSNSNFTSDTNGWHGYGGSGYWQIHPDMTYKNSKVIYLSRSGLTTDSWRELKSNHISVKETETYTMSVDIKYDNIPNNEGCIIALWGYSLDTSTRYDIGVKTVTGTSDWVRVVLTGVIPANVATIRASLSHRRNGTLYATNFKVEEGNQVTDWSPAPEDVDGKITTMEDKVSKVAITLESITSKVSSAESNITSIDGELTSLKSRVQSAEQKISADAIVSTVTSSYTYQNDLSSKASVSSVQTLEQKITSSAITTTISSALNNGTSSISTTKFIMDSSGLTIKNGALSIWNKNNTQEMIYLGSDGNVIFGGNLRMELSTNRNKYIEFKAVPYSTDIGCKLILGGDTLDNCFRIESKIGVGYFKVDRYGTYVSNNLFITSDQKDSDPIATNVAMDDGTIYPEYNNKGMIGTSTNKWMECHIVTGRFYNAEVTNKLFTGAIETNHNNINMGSGYLVCGGATVNGSITTGKVDCGTIDCLSITTNRSSITCGSLDCRNIDTNGYSVTCGILYATNVVVDDRYVVTANGSSTSQYVKGLAVLDGSSSKYLQVQTRSGGVYGVNLWNSDINLKTNIKPIEEPSVKLTNQINNKIGLEAVLAIEHYEFDYKDSNLNHINCGYISQQLLDVNENFVYAVKQDDGSDVYSPDATTIIPNLSLAIKQQNEYINMLEERIKNLESKGE